MSDKKVDEAQVANALSALQNISKGFAGGSAPFKEVESKVGETGATQIHHTAGNSDPGSWAGSTAKDVSEDDSIDGNGTDLKSAAMAKSILAELAKGNISPEVAFTLLKGFPFAKKDGDKDEDKDDKKEDKAEKAFDKKDDEDKVEKSFDDAVAADAAVQKGLEVSEFLTGLVGSLSKSLATLRSDLVKHIDTRLAQTSNKQEGFNKSLTDALVSFGEAITVQEARVQQVEREPARGPKSVGYIAKSFDGAQAQEQLPKKVVLDTLTDMVVKGLIPGQPVLKFEASGEISEELMGRVRSHRAGK